MNINDEKLKEILLELADAVDRGYSSAGTFVGTVGNKPVKIILFDMEFAIEEYDYSRHVSTRGNKDVCIS